ncbi:MAG TPA: single-stranded DNA-binding protein, partial [Firmicutes bacterium]|nr:single-stranded DNA-binding protein [Bacillota bacterium]
MLNKVILIGRLTRDPELSYTTSGIARLRFSLAVERNYSNPQGERPVDFIDVACWRQLAETCHKYLRKGLMTAVVGRLEVRSYEGNDGQKRRIAEVVADEVRFLEWPKDGSTNSPLGQRNSFEDFGREIDLNDDEDNDLPF